jgi:predicted exporter
MKSEMRIKNKNLILTLSFLAVIICLILTVLLFYSVKPSLLITLSFIVGLVSGVCITLLIHNLLNKKL